MKDRVRPGPILATIIAVVLGFVPACRTGAPGGERAERVVLVSFDGLGAPLLDRWLAADDVTTGAGLGGMAAEGLRAERVRMVNPTLTSVNHASLITGALPSATGIVSNNFRKAGDPLTRRTSGFAAPIEAEPLWVGARTAGIRTGVLLWPGADFTTDDRSGDFGIAWPNRSLVRPKISDLDPADAVPEPELPPNDGVETLRWRLPVTNRDGELLTLEIAVLDAVPDGRPRYQTIAVRTLGDDAWRYLEEREWFDTSLDSPEGPSVAWSKVLHLDRMTGRLRLYRGAFTRLPAFPEEFAGRLIEALGPWPGTPDQNALADWWLDIGDGIDLDTYIEQVERLDRYLDDVAAWVFEHEDFGLLIAYHPSPDEFLHAALLVDSDQWAWSEGAAFAAREGLLRIGRSVDRSVAALWSNLDPARDVLVVVSDHGLMPIHDEVLLNRALADEGLVKTVDEGGRTRIADDSPMAAFTSGGMGHLYLNLEGRDPGGVVRPRRADALLRRAARVLADIGVEGEPVVEKTLTRPDLPAVGLDNPNSGDMVIFLRPGYSASSRLDGTVVRPSRYYGQHGYLNHYDDLCGIFLARGTPAGRGKLREIRSVDILPKVERWLGLIER